MIGNVFSGVPLDRAAELRRDDAALAAALTNPDSRLLPVWRSLSLVKRDLDGFHAVLAGPELLAVTRQWVFLGLAQGQAMFAADISSLDSPALEEGSELADLRQIGALLPRDQAALLAYARAMVTWHGNHLFCGRCGAATSSASGGHLRRCGGCAAEHYPRTDPAVIMLVSSGDHCLLGRQAAWPAGMMSVLAGFVEPGETPEEAVAREVWEETGIRVSDISYHSAQPWPFPGQLMIGFTARAERCVELTVDPHELEQAGWFSRDDIAGFAAKGWSLPRPHSIARRLIEDWLSS